MRPIVFSSNAIAELLHAQTIATLPELATALGDCSSSTVFRKLQQIDYLTSYSHSGTYYTLRECADFDDHGLWFFNDIGFSRYGTLRSTVDHLVKSSPFGYSPAELDEVVKVRTIDVLTSLVKNDKLSRARFQGRTVYCAGESTRQHVQIEARRIQQGGMPIPVFNETNPAIAASLALFKDVLNEKQKRLFAGLISLLWGYGGDKYTAQWLGMNRKTVRKGRHELNAGDVDPNRVRKKGGGRHSLQKKTLSNSASS